MMEHEAVYRFGIFALVFISMAILELLIPKRVLTAKKFSRWVTNISFGGVNGFLVRLMAMSAVPLVAMAVAEVGTAHQIGLLRLLDLPFWAGIILALIVLDFAIYGQHFASHKIPVLWRVHRVHHSDLDIDVTTAIRFHPIEIGLSMLFKCVLVLALGIDSFAVLLFEIILNGCAMFNHSNVALPSWLDRGLRLLIVTPDMHRVHHSIIHQETDSNYGFNLAIWDRLFGTYIEQPERGHLNMEIGLKPYMGQDNPTRFGWSFFLPFRK